MAVCWELVCNGVKDGCYNNHRVSKKIALVDSMAKDCRGCRIDFDRS